MTYASDNLPRSSRPLPIITVVLISYIIISAFISVGTVIGLRLHKRMNSSSPPNILLKLCCLSSWTSTRKKKTDTLSELDGNDKEWHDTISKKFSWKDVADRFDKFCFIVSNVCSFLLTFTYFCIVRVLNT